MKGGALLMALLLLVPVGLSLAEGQSGVGVSDKEVGGLRVIFKPVDGETVGVQMFFDGGVTDQTAENQGIDALLMKASMRESEKYPREKMISELTRMGTSIGADVYYDYTTAYMHCVKQNFDNSWDIFADILMNPSLKEEDVELVRSQLITSARQKRDQPEDYVVDLSNSMLYGNHPYALDPYGIEESLGRMTIEDLKGRQRELMVKSRMLLVVVGDFSEKEIENYASVFSSLPEGTYKRKELPEVSNAGGLRVEHQDIPNTYIRGVFRAPGMNDKDYYAACVAQDILSDTLWEEVRTKRGLAYSVGSGLSSRRDNYAMVSVTTNSPDGALRVVRDELNKGKKETLSADRIEEAVNGYITRFYLNNEDTLSQAYQLGLWELNGGGWEKNFEFVDNLRRVTPKDVRNFFNRYAKGISMAAVGGQNVTVRL